MRSWRNRAKWVVVLALVLSVGFGAGIRVASAGHSFADVPNSSPWHNFVDWLVNRNITAGCGGGNYCPDDPITRGQMAVFMNQLGVALTPVDVKTTTET